MEKDSMVGKIEGTSTGGSVEPYKTRQVKTADLNLRYPQRNQPNSFGFMTTSSSNRADRIN
jgi:hypothetical protein